MNVDDYLGPKGLFAREVPDFSFRPGQLELARDLAAFFDSGESLFAAEAPTGLGKTFAFLVPALSGAAGGKKVLLLTKSLDLQEQLMNKDLPLVMGLMGLDLKVACLKGRGNYVCYRRAQESLTQGFLAFDDQGESSQRVVRWALEETKSGDMSELSYPSSHPAVQSLASHWIHSMGHNCPYYDRCYYYNALNAATEADVLVANYSLLFAYHAARLPFPFEFDLVVCDEAHALANSFRNTSTVPLTWKSTFKVLERMPDELDSERAFDVRNALVEGMQALQAQVALFTLDTPFGTDGKVITAYPPDVTDEAKHLALQAEELRKQAATLIERDPSSASVELTGFVKHLGELSHSLNLCFDTDLWPSWVFSLSDEGPKAMQVECSEDIPAVFFDVSDRAVQVAAVSATLCVDGRFDFFSQETGLKPERTKRYPSPFDLPRQMSYHVVDLGCGVRDEPYPGRVARVVHRYALDQKGHTLVLLSSRRLLEAVEDFFVQAGELGNPLRALSVNELSRSEAIKEFRRLKGEGVVLLGLESFKEGLDLPGEQLTQVIIDRIPFEHIHNPVVLAKQEQLGSSCFMLYQLPAAKMNLVQAMGRLIRRDTDRGRVVLLDARALDRKNWKVDRLYEGIFPRRVRVKDSSQVNS